VRQLLTAGQSSTKIRHSLERKRGRKVRAWIMYLAPAESSGVANLCAHASPGCKALCLQTAGRMAMDNATHARQWRTEYLHNDPAAFMRQLRAEIACGIKVARRTGALPVFRLDGTSDIGLGVMLAGSFPTARFYDYTKSARRMMAFLSGQYPANYHLTFSRSETNGADVDTVIRAGGNVAVPFTTRRGKRLPRHWHGVPVIDGDKSDFRFLDPRGRIVGLRAKGRARKSTGNGFVVTVGR
jgi:hypothetical protein